MYQKRALELIDDGTRRDEHDAVIIVQENPCHLAGIFFTGIDMFGRDIDEYIEICIMLL